MPYCEPKDDFTFSYTNTTRSLQKNGSIIKRIESRGKKKQTATASTGSDEVELFITLCQSSEC